eukprot:GHVH01002561.1.p1 GENE.GHVH01002561.1~~GHVH01002561.1.p1  ORF type:complete len:347 (+),score=33.93 GHVH01002561.1:1046-2086(+)
MPDIRNSGVQQRSEVLSPAQTLHFLIQKGEHKVLGDRKARQMLQAVTGGIFVGMIAHCATVMYGAMLNQEIPSMVAKVMYGVIFNAAIVMIILTGADLATSDMLYSWTLLCHCWFHMRGDVSPTILIIAGWCAMCVAVSIFGNWMGAAGFAAAFSQLVENEDITTGICNMAAGKLSESPFIVYLTGILANMFVGFATWLSYVAMSVEGKVLATSLPIIAFCVGGGNHVIANMYTLYTAYYIGCPDVSWADVSTNLVFSLLGNLTASILLGTLISLHFNPDSRYGEIYEITYVTEAKSAEAICEAEDMAELVQLKILKPLKSTIHQRSYTAQPSAVGNQKTSTQEMV